MHAKGRARGKVLRYIKRANRVFFSRPEPRSEVRAIKGQHHIDHLKNRQPEMPEHTVPKASRTRKSSK